MNEVGRMKIIGELSSKERCSRIAFLSIVIFVLIIGIVSIFLQLKCIDKPFPGFLFTKRLVVAGAGRLHWTGMQAGLKYTDKILKANNKNISRVSDLEDVINNTGVGQSITYTFKRGNHLFERTIRMMRFTKADLLIISGVAMFTGFAYLLLGIIVFILKPDRMVSWAHFLFCIFMSLYNMFFCIIYISYDWIWYALFCQTFFPAAGIHLSLIFPEQKKFVEKYPSIQFIPYIISTIIVIFLEIFYLRPECPTIYAFVFLYIIMIPIMLLVSILYTYFRKASILARQRAKVMLIGTALAFPFPAAIIFMSYFGITLGKVMIPHNFIPIPVLIFPTAIAYAIVRHNLFDVDVFIKRTVGYIIMTIIVGAAYVGIESSLSNFVLYPLLGRGHDANMVFPIIFAVLVVLFFEPMKHMAQTFVDKLFYRKKYDYQKTITSVSDTLSSVLNTNEIIRQLIHTVRKEMFIDTAGVILLDHKSKSCQSLFVDEGNDRNKDHIRDVCVAYDDPLLNLLSSKKELITKYDIAEDPHYKDIRKACGKSFLEMEASLAFPLIYRDEIKGVFTLGHKKSGHFFTREDIDLLKTLASHGTVAMENARLFEENLDKFRMEEELKIGHDIQMSMMPEKAPEVRGFEIAARSIPAREVGGDFYDFIEIGNGESDNRLAIVLGDVSGKGVSAGLVMAASRSTYRALTDDVLSVEKVMNMGNHRLNSDIKRGMFVALIYAVLSPDDGILTLSNAGQTQPILCSDIESEPSYITTDGDSFPLGIIGDCRYREKQVRLTEGNTVVFYTDGVVEAMNEKEEMYGFERLMASVDDGRELNAASLLEKLMSDVERFVGDAKPHDDITIIVVKAEKQITDYGENDMSLHIH